MEGLKSLVHEIHRRSLWQVLGIYLAGSWVALQVVEFLTRNVGLPGWVLSFALVILVIGLPIVMATAVVQEGVGGDALSADAAVEGAAPAADASVEDRVPARGTGPTAGTPGGPGGVASGEGTVGRASRRGLLTWKNALLGGAGAFALLGLFTAGYLLTRSLGVGPAGTLVAAGVLDERARVLIAEFEAESDPELARAATESFRVDFGQSRVVKVVQPTEISSVLERMGRDPADRLVESLAREVAIREGIPAIVTGDVHSAGGGYVVSAQLVAVESGEVLVPVRETARDSSGTIDAIDRLSSQMRERIGESLRRLRAEPPLERVTTSSLSALRKYSQAMEAIDVEGDVARGIALLEEAIAEDSAFAMAHRKLGVVLNNRTEDRARQVEALSAAYRHRDRLTERERYHAEAMWHYNGTGDVERARSAYRNLVELDPSDVAAHHNLGITYAYLRDGERAMEQFARAVEIDSSHAISYVAMITAAFLEGRMGEARAVLDRFAERFPGDPAVDIQAAGIDAATGDYEAAELRIDSLRRRTATSAYWRYRTSRDLWALDAIRGRLASASGHMGDVLSTQEERGLPGEYLANAVNWARAELRATGRAAPALARVEEALSRHPLEDVHPLNRPYAALARFYAEAGRPGRARRLLAEFRAEVPEEVREWQRRIDLDRAEGEIAMAEGRPGQALAAFRRSDVGLCTICALADIARAHEALSRPDSAIVYYRRYLEEPWLYRTINVDPWHKAASLERLARLYDEAGDLENAATYYRRFVELWRDADPELEPRVEAARARLEEIGAARAPS